jgi:phenylalanyl-tRNA synthetase beta chain
MVGYNNLPTTPPLAPITPKLRGRSTRSPFAVRRLLAGLGYQETINFSFVEERWEHELAGNADPIKLLNPIASQMSVMRSTLLGSLLQVLKFNLDRKAERVRVFELGRVFLRDASVANTDTTVEGFHQPMRVAGLAYGARRCCSGGAKSRAIDFFDVKGDVEALLAPLRATFEPGRAPGHAPWPLRRVLAERSASDRLCGRVASALAPVVGAAPGAGDVRAGAGRRAAAHRAAVQHAWPSTRRWSAIWPSWWRAVTHAR